jgi:SAM-dependent methyltransferase
MQSGRLKEFYEKDADRFWDPRRGMVGRDLHIYPLLRGLSGRVLEYGCGAGSLLLALAQEDRFTSLCGVDISEKALSRIRETWTELRRDGGKLTLMTPEDDRLPKVASASVDVILSLDTIEHVLDPYVVLDELHRVAAEDAVFVISVPNYAYIKYVVQLFFGKQPVTGSGEPVENWREAGWDGWHLHTFTKSSLAVLLRDCGWEPQHWTGYGERYSWLGLDILRKHFPGFWSGALTAVCRKKPAHR